MPQDLGPLSWPIAEKDQSASTFFRQQWEIVRASMRQVPTEARINASAQAAAVATTTVLSVPETGDYEVGYYIRKTTADGVSSSLIVTIGWTENGQALTRVFAALAMDAVTANQSDVIPILADSGTTITIAIAYASNTPGTMQFLYRAVARRMA